MSDKTYFQKNRGRIIVTALILLALLFLVFFGGTMFVKHRLPVKYEEFVTKYAAENGLDPYFVYAVISAESSFDPDAVSRADARGLMQVTPNTAAFIGKKKGLPYDDLFDPETNVRLGCAYFAYLSERFGGALPLMIAAYNGGEGNVSEWLKNPAYSSDGKTLSVIPFKETSQYVKKVTVRYEIYQKLYA